MRTIASIGVTVLITFALTWSAASTRAASDPPLLVPDQPVAQDIPGAKELPDPKTDYKVVFSIAQGAQKEGEVNPMLKTMALYLNTLAKAGVPAEHRHIIAVFHQRSADFDIIMSNDAYKAHYNGKSNPNIALIHELKQAGVDFRACGQGVLARKIGLKEVNPDIQVDLWAMTTFVNLAMKGYVRIG